MRRALVLGLMLLGGATIGGQAVAQRHPSLMGRIHQIAKDEIIVIRQKAIETYNETPRVGSCEDRRQHILAILPQALRHARLARDIYSDGYDDEMAATGALSLDLGDGRTAFRDPEGEHYAELRAEPDQVIVTFRGTRVDKLTDLYTDVANHIGLNTAYYTWAAELVRRTKLAYPDRRMVASGQSLGGGLAIYSALHNPGVVAFAFNPAGLSKISWALTTRNDRNRVNNAVTVITTRNENQIEPISALSFAGRSVIPGRIFVIKTAGVTNERILHGPANIVSGLEQLAESQAIGAACDGELGILAN